LTKKTIKVIGSGPTGSLLALSLASELCNVVLIEPLSDSDLLAKDKGYAVTQCTRNIFQELGIWSDLEKYAYGFTSLSIIDDVLSQSVLVNKSDLKIINKNQTNIGWVIEHKDLMQLLINNINNNQYIKKFNYDSTSDKNFDFVLAADGRESSARKIWEIKYFKSFYKQKCVSFKAIINGLPNKRAYEIFRSEGPLALLPLSENLYQVIWFSSESATKSKLKLSKAKLLEKLRKDLPNNIKPEAIINNISSFSVAKAFALTNFSKYTNILVGDSAHSFHPVGGQGLNSCIRDVYELSTLIKSFDNLSIINRKFFSLKYFLNRSLDIISLIIFTDFLIRFFSNKFILFYPLRYLIFYMLKKFKFVRINIFSVMTDSIKRYKFSTQKMD
tara:strand:- start:474 stop:1634 length:1161 start_codon:yes stop_codon:yes gene_type:complete